MLHHFFYPRKENGLDDQVELEIMDGEVINNNPFEQYLSAPISLSIGEVLNAFGSFPPYSLLLGVCKDGLPLMLNLKDSSAGSLLIEGEPRRGKTQILKTILASAAALNHVEQVNFCAISSFPDELAVLYNLPHCQGLAAPYERQACEIILELCAISEQRRYGRERGPAFILAIDNLDALLGEHLDFEVLLHLRWLISKGPYSEIWTIATLPSHSAAPFDPQILSLFHTRIASGRSTEIIDNLEKPENNLTLSMMNCDFTFVTRINHQLVQFLPLAVG